MLNSRAATVWMVQADHLSGEILGVVLQRLLDLGATNVQIMPTITKKNRPGHIIFIDVVNDEVTEPIEQFLVHELGISGHHRWKSEHYYAVTENAALTLRAKTADRVLTLKVYLKMIGEEGASKFPRIEHDSAVEVQREIAQEFGHVISLREIASIAESALAQNLTEATIELNGCRIQRYQ